MDSARLVHALLRVLRGCVKAQVIVALLVVSSQLGQTTSALAAPLTSPVGVAGAQSAAFACGQGGHADGLQVCKVMSQTSAVDDAPRLTLPVGGHPCPSSGPSASCNAGDSAAQLGAGVASLPAGKVACPIQPGQTSPNAPAACDDTIPSALQPVAPAGQVAPSILPARVTPSIPSWTLSAADPQPRVRLTSSATALKPGQRAILTATANASVANTGSAIEIFDQTTNTLVGACMQGSQCQVGYAAKSGVRTFAAFVTPPTAGAPTESVITSNAVTVGWFGLTLTASSPLASAVVGPGKAITFTATSTADVSGTGYQLGLYDAERGTRLTYCSRGTICSTSLTKEQAGSRSIVAYIAAASETLPPPSVQAQSPSVSATWLGVNLDANTTRPQPGTTVFMRATANVNVANTPWSIGIYDQNGDLVGASCKSGTTCTARVTITTGATPWFTAVAGAARPTIVQGNQSTLVQLVQTAQQHASLFDIQARSNPMQPTRLLWGVDSCKPLTSDVTGASGLYAQVTRSLGSPDFWGRYMTTTYNCPGISSTEIAAAAFHKMGILPIYDDYDCSAVHSYKTGLSYANQATVAAANLGIPLGTVLAIDIEPYGDQCPGAANVDAGFIGGWYDGITLAGYEPLYYGNGTAGSEFGSAWCRAVSGRPEIAANSYLWSFEPSLLGSFYKAKAPAYSPEEPGCIANMGAWQYLLSSGGRADVDSDEAISKLPLWFPTS